MSTIHFRLSGWTSAYSRPSTSILVGTSFLTYNTFTILGMPSPLIAICLTLQVDFVFVVVGLFDLLPSEAEHFAKFDKVA